MFRVYTGKGTYIIDTKAKTWRVIRFGELSEPKVYDFCSTPEVGKPITLIGPPDNPSGKNYHTETGVVIQILEKD